METQRWEETGGTHWEFEDLTWRFRRFLGGFSWILSGFSCLFKVFFGFCGCQGFDFTVISGSGSRTAFLVGLSTKTRRIPKGSFIGHVDVETVHVLGLYMNEPRPNMGFSKQQSQICHDFTSFSRGHHLNISAITSFGG